MKTIDVLIVDDDSFDRRSVKRLLKSAFPNIAIREAAGREDAMRESEKEPDVVIFDYRLPGCSGLEVMADFVAKWPYLTCIVMTGEGDEDIATAAIKGGAFDYINKSKLTESAVHRMVTHGLERSDMNRKIDQQRQELEVFADVLIHDLKAPIRAVAFLTEQIRTDMEDGDEASVKTGFDLLARSAKQMGSLIDSLAKHIRLNKDAEFEDASLRDMVEAAVNALQMDISEGNATVILDFEDRQICCCAPQITQLLQNLISNAIKYRADDDPRIVISVGAVTEDRITILVKDNGTGIPEVFLDRIFEPFKRAPSRQGVTGTGLGLATCVKVAQRHGGTITCSSEVDVGSTFSIDMALSHEANRVRCAV